MSSGAYVKAFTNRRLYTLGMAKRYRVAESGPGALTTPCHATCEKRALQACDHEHLRIQQRPIAYKP
jgi:hypothetical protein